MWFSKTQHVQLHLSDSTWPLTWTGMAKLFRGSRRLTFNHLTGLDITTVTLPWHKRTWIIFKAGTKLLLLHNFSWFGKVLLKLLGLSPEKRLLKRKEIHRKYMLIHGWFEGFPYQMVCTIVNINIKQVKALFWSKMMKDFRVVNFTQHFWRRFKFSGMWYIHFFCVPLNLPLRCLPNSEKFLGGLTIPFSTWIEYNTVFCVPLNLPPRCLPNSEKPLYGLTIPFWTWIGYNTVLKNHCC